MKKRAYFHILTDIRHCDSLSRLISEIIRFGHIKIVTKVQRHASDTKMPESKTSSFHGGLCMICNGLRATEYQPKNRVWSHFGHRFATVIFCIKFKQDSDATSETSN